VLPAAPGYYHRPTEVGQLVDFVVQRVVDQMQLDITFMARWRSGE
jgi:4-hydroxy-3-polyprenylbenzoate decarboxylase